MDGILIIDKSADWTSHDVVAKLRRILNTKKIGHTGTLDPFATGVMAILVGKATRLARFLDKDRKEYEATVRFGFETDTGDLTGSPRAESEPPRSFSNGEIETALEKFRGQIMQTPPMYSAKKIDGKKLYELARQGIEVERKAVAVEIFELEVIPQEANETDLNLRILCSAGTYIRTLAEDIGRSLGSAAHLAALRRIRAGRFGIERAVTLEKLEEIIAAGDLGEIVVTMSEALGHLNERKLAADELAKIRNGIALDFVSTESGDFFRMVDEAEGLAAVGFYDREKNLLQPRIVLL